MEVNNFAHIDELMESKTFLKKTEVAAKSGTCNEGPDKTNAKDWMTNYSERTSNHQIVNYRIARITVSINRKINRNCEIEFILN